MEVDYVAAGAVISATTVADCHRQVTYYSSKGRIGKEW
jgi:hypothetical protein